VRARRAQAEIAARAGRWRDAYEELRGLAGVEFEQGEALDLLGCAALELGRRDEALSLHRRARPLLEKKLPADHPSLLRNTLYQEAAAAKQGSASGCAHLF
jgi:Flp pilus assembly protein TadD